MPYLGLITVVITINMSDFTLLSLNERNNEKTIVPQF